MELIHAHVFNPVNALFKHKDNNRAKCFTYLCSNKDNCDLYKGKTCVLNNFLGGGCPYGKKSTEVGPTKRARGFSSWICDRREKYKDVLGFFSDGGYPPEKLAFVGDYVYLPYGLMTQNEEIKRFLPKARWNLDTITEIVNFRPRDWFNQEMSDYQKSTIPKFLTHLSEVCPDLYKEFVALNPSRGCAKSHIGRTAKLMTVNPGECVFGNETWYWNGSTLKRTGKDYLFCRVKKTEKYETIITPTAETTVKITDNSQVNDKTVFID